MLRMIAWEPLRAELHRYVARRVPASDADDVVQEALLRIHRGLPSVRADGALVGWLYQVTRHAVVDHLRARRTTTELDAELDAEPAADPIVDDAAFSRLSSCIAPFVAMLSSPYREAVELVELRGVTQVEAARQLDIPLSTMKSRVQRGRAQLRASLEQCCAIELDTRGHVVDVIPRPIPSCACAGDVRSLRRV